MYEASDAYKLAVRQPTRKSRITGSITLTSGTVIDLTDADIIKDSLYIKNQCVNESDFNYGSVYAAECGLICVSDIDRYTLFGSAIALKWGIYTGAAWEDIPLGVFYVAEANRIGKKISIKAYDAMLYFDADILADFGGTAYDLLSFSCTQCGVELGSTQAEIEAMPNGTTVFPCKMDQVGTYRDLLGHIGAMLAAFATIGKDGKLYLKQFGTTSVLTLPKTCQKMGTTVSDYKTEFRGITARFIAQENYYPYEKYIADKVTGLVLDDGDIPIMTGDPEDKYAALDNILTVLGAVSYVPAKIEIMSDPCIELGDKITIGGFDVDTLVTSLCWNYRKTQTITGAGSNPRLASAKDGTSKQLSQLSTAVASNASITVIYTNAAELTINNTIKTVISTDFSVTGGSAPIFQAVLPIFASGHGHVVVEYYLDGALMTGGSVTYNAPKGYSVLPLYIYIETADNNRHTLSVKAYTVQEENTMRYVEARIFHQFLDSTEEVATVAVGAMKAALIGRGLAAGATKWDGTLQVEETLDAMPAVMATSVIALSDAESDTEENGTVCSLADAVPALACATAGTLNSMTESVAVQLDTVQNIVTDLPHDERYVENGQPKSVWTFNSVPQLIDTGNCVKIEIDNTGITATETEVDV